MNGMNRHTGKLLTGDAHLAQSVGDILATAIGSRVMRRDYGSALPALIDTPLNTGGLARQYAASAGALRAWEPRIAVTKVTQIAASIGSTTLQITGVRTDAPQPNSLVTLTIPLAPAQNGAPH